MLLSKIVAGKVFLGLFSGGVPQSNFGRDTDYPGRKRFIALLHPPGKLRDGALKGSQHPPFKSLSLPPPYR
jgi:hypothetical protein